MLPKDYNFGNGATLLLPCRRLFKWCPTTNKSVIFCVCFPSADAVPPTTNSIDQPECQSQLCPPWRCSQLCGGPQLQWKHYCSQHQRPKLCKFPPFTLKYAIFHVKQELIVTIMLKKLQTLAFHTVIFLPKSDTQRKCKYLASTECAYKLPLSCS